jgi:hypothetical protein
VNIKITYRSSSVTGSGIRHLSFVVVITGIHSLALSLYVRRRSAAGAASELGWYRPPVVI